MANKLKVIFTDPNMTKKAATEADTDTANLNKKELSEALYYTINQIKKGDEKSEIKLTKTLAQEIVTALFDEEGIIADFLFAKPAPKSNNAKHSGNKVTIPGFGTFSTRYRKERPGVHPAYDSKDGKWNPPGADKMSAKERDAKIQDLEKKYKNGKITIDATYVVSFKAGKGLKDRAATVANKK